MTDTLDKFSEMDSARAFRQIEARLVALEAGGDGGPNLTDILSITGASTLTISTSDVVDVEGGDAQALFINTGGGADSADGIPGNGGLLAFATGTGGNVTGIEDAYGGTGGQITIFCGNGGDSADTNGGSGGNLNLNAGTGGEGALIGGNGGEVQISSGPGNDGATGGIGGTIRIVAGSGGGGADAAGNGGDLIISIPSKGSGPDGRDGQFMIGGLPTDDPLIDNAFWLDGGVFTISAGSP